MSKPPAVPALLADAITVCEALEARYTRRKINPHVEFIEALIWQILELGTTEKAARDALKRLRDEYVDWNDIRVASVREIEDILGPKYYRVREKAEDCKHLLADIYTGFRRMDIKDLLNQDGIATLRALPETTNIRADMVERALVIMLDVKVVPIDEDQFRLLKLLSSTTKHLGPALKPQTFAGGMKKLEEAIASDTETTLRLARGLREHVHTCQIAGEDEPQIIAFGWDQKDPLGMDKPDAKKKKK